MDAMTYIKIMPVRCADAPQTPTDGVYPPYHMQIPLRTYRCTEHGGHTDTWEVSDMWSIQIYGASKHMGPPFTYHMQIPPSTYRCIGEHGGHMGVS